MDNLPGFQLTPEGAALVEPCAEARFQGPDDAATVVPPSTDSVIAASKESS